MSDFLSPVNDRIAIRCADCLSVGFIEQEFDEKWTCGMCGGKVEFMGKVVQTQLEKEEWKAPCDKRCTHARGPFCDCRCKCEHHGSGRRVKVVVRQELPKIEFNDAKARGRLEEFKTLYTEKLLLVSKMSFFEKLKNEALLNKAIDSRQHAARMRALRRISNGRD